MSDPEKLKSHALFFSLFVPNQESLYRYILSLCANYQDADDILQETATVMWEKFDTFNREGNFLSWAIRIANYKILNFRKKKKNCLLDASTLAAIESEAVQDVERERAWGETLRRCLLNLRDADRRLVAMRYEHNRPLTEIAQSLGRSVNGLYNAMSRIHHSLRLCIQRTLQRESMP
jgi:RNA polymerase sigma-70 factor (ECF subfamily)